MISIIDSSSNNNNNNESMELLNHLICNWCTSYKYSLALEEVEHDPDDPGVVHEYYRSIWSKLSLTQPVPQAVVNVHFRVTIREDKREVSYHIENERFERHAYPPDPLAFQEVWLDEIIQGQQAAQEQLHKLKILASRKGL